LVFGLIFLSAASFVSNVLTDPHMLPPVKGMPFVAFSLFILGGAGLVGVYWAVWWYKKKDFFTE
jgi:hypothetical protein